MTAVRPRDLRGLVPGLTGGVPAEEWVRRIRDDERTGYATENIESISIEEAEALETWVSNITVQPGNGRLNNLERFAEVHRIASLPLADREGAIMSAIDAAYTEGWDEANQQWAAYVLELPAGSA